VCEVQLQLSALARGRAMVAKPMRRIEDALAALLAEVPPGLGCAAPLLARLRQAHCGSGASLPFATTEHVPQQQFNAHQRRGTLRQTSPSAARTAHGFAAPK
jgi:hypothetical protein